jgi:hypothetical protein
MVVVWERAWKVPARALATRVRLCAMAQRIVQAALALNEPVGRWAGVLAAASAMTCSMIAWPRC